jgi:hypothetical protein
MLLKAAQAEIVYKLRHQNKAFQHITLSLMPVFVLEFVNVILASIKLLFATLLVPFKSASLMNLTFRFSSFLFENRNA